jgi:4-hydroxybenzoate polyprenyltransferase
LPNENPPSPRFFEKIEAIFYSLQLYGAVGITAFGWAMGRLLGIDSHPSLPLWFCAAVLIYNVDRLRPDPADPLNIPRRAAACAEWRWLIRIVVAVGGIGLIGLPIWRRDWLTLGLVVMGGAVALSYSVPILGWRWKDIPVLKTLFAPSLVTAAIFGLLLIRGFSADQGEMTGLSSRLLLLPWAFIYLLFNMLLCDFRDRVGDAATGVRSIPVLLGERGTRILLWLLAALGQMIFAVGLSFLRDHPLPFGVLAAVSGFYQVALILSVRGARSERFYEWAVEGLLYVPALVIVATFPLKIATP